MDLLIVRISITAVIILLLSQIAVFRFIHPEQAVRYTIKLYFLIFGGLLAFIFGAYPDDMAVIAAGSSLLYGSIGFLYIFSVFGPMEASLTLRLISDIKAGGVRGLTRKEILAAYNRRSIVKRRIERFMISGDMVKRNGKYELSRKKSYLGNREYFLEALRKLYPLST